MSNNTEFNPEAVPQHCPGPKGEEAGEADACAGCPNQSACRDAPKGPDPDVGRIRERLSGVKHKVLILSGKGGVGKSTFSSQFARHLASLRREESDATMNDDNDEDEDDERLDVGLLDIDICGPSQPKIMGCESEQVHQSSSGWSPVYVDDNLSVMSVGFMLSDPNEAVIWRGPKKNGLIKQFLRDVEWGDLDYLVVDTPPGTSDEHLSIVQYLKNCDGVEGAVLVTTPQEVALMDVRKEINFCKKVGMPILGVVENMNGFVCPKCNNETKIFPATSGGGEQMANEMNIPFLGSTPIDPALARACDEGKSYAEAAPDAAGTKAFQAVFNKIHQAIQNKNKQ